MPAPTNRQEVPAPHRDWTGANEVDAPASRALGKIARLWRPVRTLLEPMGCTLARYAHRVIDRTTGIPYSADELEAKILAQPIASTGVTDGSNAAAGKIGEVISASLLPGLGVALTNDTATTVFSINLTAGDWDVSGQVGFILTSATASGARSDIMTEEGNMTIVTGFVCRHDFITTSETSHKSHPLPARRINLAEPTTIYLRTRVAFSGTITAHGFLHARRAR